MTDLDPVMVGEPLWVLTKDGHVAEAPVRAIPDYSLELRFSIDGELYYSHRFTAWEPLEQAAREKRGDLRRESGSTLKDNDTGRISGQVHRRVSA